MNIEKRIGKRYIVLCKDSREWNFFCDERMRIFEETGMHQGDEYFRGSNPDSIRGLRVDDIIVLDGFENNPDKFQLGIYAQTCVF